ncbi:AMP-binding protein [Nocardia arthritidis]|uniref:AMP-binding protein n=1 Tax=Nocardia arthritidis TaxID=228602 RepID=A0A6G9YE18_9NOCA|nr:AMP-binding protein [Nocardia arthritidis]
MLRNTAYRSCGGFFTVSRCFVRDPSVPPTLPAIHNFAELLRARSEDKGEQRAFVFLNAEGEPEQMLTYGELQWRACAVAERLRDRVSPGDRALLLHPPGLEYVVSFFGCLYAGVIAVPLYPVQRNKLGQVEAIAEDCAAAVIMTTPAVAAEMATQTAGSPLGELPVIAVDMLSDPSEPTNSAQIAEPTAPDADARIAYLQYTSGSTSTPKGVIVTHRMLAHQCAELVAGWGVGDDAVVVSWLPHFHDFGQLSGVLLPVYAGIEAVLMAPSTFVKQPIRWLAAVTEYRGTHCGAPNFAYDLCVDRTTPQQRFGLDLSSWQLVCNGAEPVRKATLDRFQRMFEPYGLSATALSPGYGLAEATLKVASSAPDSAYTATAFDESALGLRRVVPGSGPDATELVGCGRPVLWTEIAIVAPESGLQVGANEVGEIWVSGPSTAPGYWDRPEDTERTFRARITGADDDKTWLRTGDLGFEYEGELYICGRVKNLMIVNGVNYYLEDIESTVVNSDTSLSAGAVIAFAVEQDGVEGLVLVAEYRAGGDPAPADLVTTVHDAVARRHALAPAVIVFIESGTIPRTTSGKLRRQQCRADFRAGRLAEIHRWEGIVTVTETAAAQENSSPQLVSMFELVRAGLLVQIADWITRNLGPDAPRLDQTRSLAEHGLGSVHQMNLHEALETWSGKRFPPELMWDAETVEEMTGLIAAHIVPGGSDTSDEIVRATEDPTGVGVN